MQVQPLAITSQEGHVFLLNDSSPRGRQFQRLQARLIQRRPEWQVIGEASDGLEAVEKVTELKPDLILLGIGLPGLNGIEAARRIQELSPNSKILFAGNAAIVVATESHRDRLPQKLQVHSLDIGAAIERGR
jgi:DNA-binding NarL/FixJ family response regulator